LYREPRLPGRRLRPQINGGGRSAFYDENAEVGQLAKYLSSQPGKIEAGSVLIIESLDRLSRDALTKALPRVLDLINAGSGVVTPRAEIWRYASAQN
jgi:hypothetical protein